MTEKEMRARTRAQVEALVGLTGPDGILSDLPARDLSLKGLFVETDKKWGKGTELGISLSLAGSDDNLDLKMKGRVARLEEDGLAVDFFEIDLDSFTHLKNIIAYNAEDPGKIDEEISSKPAFK